MTVVCRKRENVDAALERLRRSDVPMGYVEFPRQILHPPRSVAARQYSDIRRWTTLCKGGHFAALEQPEVLAHEIREFFRPSRTASRALTRCAVLWVSA